MDVISFCSIGLIKRHWLSIDRRFYYDRGERVFGEWMKGDFRECEVMGFWGRNANPMKRQVEKGEANSVNGYWFFSIFSLMSN